MVAGNRGGRPPKPHGLHVLQGTFRKHRHGKQMAITQNTSGEPITAPEGMRADAAALFMVLARDLAHILQPSDVFALQALCECWSLYRRCLPILEADPTNKDARLAAVSYINQFDRIAARFGLTPSDRARLRIEPPREPDAFEKYLSKKNRVNNAE